MNVGEKRCIGKSDKMIIASQCYLGVLVDFFHSCFSFPAWNIAFVNAVQFFLLSDFFPYDLFRIL